MAEKISQAGQAPLFIEDAYDALKAAVNALGGPKVVGGRLWPKKRPEQARGDLLDALNRGNPRKLDVEEVITIIRWAREAGFHQAKHWIDEATGYEASAPTDPKLKEDRIASVIESATGTLTAALKQLADLREGKGRR